MSGGLDLTCQPVTDDVTMTVTSSILKRCYIYKLSQQKSVLQIRTRNPEWTRGDASGRGLAAVVPTPARDIAVDS